MIISVKILFTRDKAFGSVVCKIAVIVVFCSACSGLSSYWRKVQNVRPWYTYDTQNIKVIDGPRNISSIVMGRQSWIPFRLGIWRDFSTFLQFTYNDCY